MNQILLGIGSNKSDRIYYINRCIKLLSRYFSIKNISSTIETLPLGNTKNKYLNLVVEIATLFSPYRVLEKTSCIEKKLERERFEKWGYRTIDVDILTYNNIILKEPKLVIPHPQMHKRRFVLEPLCELCPDAKHPVIKKSYRELLEVIDGNM
ncbi:MAG: 2-amino-4-hydroxy-6-hydroxymethyldihydropteridine diphosphokinase [Planctomycetota bacterium]